MGHNQESGWRDYCKGHIHQVKPLPEEGEAERSLQIDGWALAAIEAVDLGRAVEAELREGNLQTDACFLEVIEVDG